MINNKITKIKTYILIITITAIILSGCGYSDITDISYDSVMYNIQMLFEETPEYPVAYLPQYGNSEVISYAYDSKTHTIYTTSASTDSFDNLAQYYANIIKSNSNIDYKSEYLLDNQYFAYGMIGNFTFLIEILKATDNIKGDYTYTITTNIHYLLDSELKTENDFRELKGTNASVYINPSIKIRQKTNDTAGVYFEFPIYKMQLIDQSYDVELYINNKLYAAAKNTNTIRVDINDLSHTNTIKMIAYDQNNCVRGLGVIDKLFMLNAVDSVDISHITGEYENISTLYIYNVSHLSDISSILALPNLTELYIIGDNKISDYSCILQVPNMQLLCLDGIDNQVIGELSTLDNLNTLILKNSTYKCKLNDMLKDTSIVDLEIINCDNINLSSSISNVVTVERIRLSANNAIKLLQFKKLHPSLRIIEVDKCHSFEDIVGMDNIVNLNMLKISDCANFLPAFPFDNLFNLGYVSIDNCPLIDGESTVSKTLFSNNSIFGFDISYGFDGYGSHYNVNQQENEGVQ